MKKTLSTLFLLILLCARAQAADTVISGLAMDGTKNKPLAGATVQLIKPRDGDKRDLLATVKTDANGRFAFAPRKYGESELLMANIRHGGFDYWSVAYDGGDKLKNVGISVDPKNVDLLVFDTTTQPVPITYQVHHLAIESMKDGVKCVERIVVENATKKTFLGVGPRKITLLLNLPPDAQNVRLDPKITDAELVKTSNGWGVVRPITPDAYNVRQAIIVDYEMKWPSSMPWDRKVNLSREVAYPTKFFFVARTTADKDLQVTAPDLSQDQDAPVPIDGKTENRIINSVGSPMGETPSVEAGKNIVVTVSRPVPAIFWGFAGLTVAICLFLPLALLKPRRKVDANRVKSSEPSLAGSVLVPSSMQGGSDLNSLVPAVGLGTSFALTDANRDLIQRIADLDDLFETGGIQESEYREQRAAWKKKLLESLGNSSHQES